MSDRAEPSAISPEAVEQLLRIIAELVSVTPHGIVIVTINDGRVTHFSTGLLGKTQAAAHQSAIIHKPA